LNVNALQHSKRPVILVCTSLVLAPSVLPEVKRDSGTSWSRPGGTSISLGQGGQAATSDGPLDQLGRELGSPTLMGLGHPNCRVCGGNAEERTGSSLYDVEALSSGQIKGIWRTVF